MFALLLAASQARVCYRRCCCKWPWVAVMAYPFAVWSASTQGSAAGTYILLWYVLQVYDSGEGRFQEWVSSSTFFKDYVRLLVRLHPGRAPPPPPPPHTHTHATRTLCLLSYAQPSRPCRCDHAAANLISLAGYTRGTKHRRHRPDRGPGWSWVPGLLCTTCSCVSCCRHRRR